MNYCVNKAEDFVSEIKDAINTDEVDVVICPNFVALDRLMFTQKIKVHILEKLQ